MHDNPGIFVAKILGTVIAVLNKLMRVHSLKMINPPFKVAYGLIYEFSVILRFYSSSYKLAQKLERFLAIFLLSNFCKAWSFQTWSH